MRKLWFLFWKQWSIFVNDFLQRTWAVASQSNLQPKTYLVEILLLQLYQKSILTLVLWVDYISTTHFPAGRLSGTIKVSTTATGPHLEGWLPGNMSHLFLVVLFLSFQVWPSSKNTEHATVITSYRDNHLQWLPSTYSDYHLQWLPPTYLYLNRSRSERPRDTEAQKTGPVCRHKKCSHYRGCLGHV